MICTAEYLINKRKEKWAKFHSIEEDRKFREAVANELFENEELRKEVKNNPEYLIELEFVIVDKKQQTVPFFLNDVQKKFIDIINKAREDYKNGIIIDLTFLVLKGRQQGLTSVITAYQLVCSILNRNFQGFTLADKAENTEAIFQSKAKFPYEQLPEILKPTEKFNNKKQLLFEKLNSNWSVDTATENVGRSKTINFFHGSECAFWKSISKVQAGLGEAFTIDCIKIYESTANGYNDFQKMWKNKTGILCFFEWWETKEYRTNFENKESKELFIQNIKNNRKEWIFERIRILIEEKGLELEQVYWYYKKYQNYIDKELIKQEYPCSPEEAFLSSGNCYFNTENIINRLTQIKEPIKRGSFFYDYDGNKITNIRFKQDINGFIDIFEEPKANYPYVLSGDTAGEGSDFLTGQVLENTTGKQVAKLRKQFDSDEYTRQMYCLGKYYNNALIGVETNFDTYPIKELLRLGYKKQYIREKEDNYTGKHEKAFGFRTDRITRPLILSILQSIVNDHIELINDKETLEEMLVFVRNEKGRPEAQEGCHDDLVMSLAIAYYIRTQQDMQIKTKPVEDIQKEIEVVFGFKKEQKNERDAKIVVF